MSRSAGVRSPRKVARRLKVLPRARAELRSWPRFMRNYALGLAPGKPYVFRNGARLVIGRGIEHAPVVEVFLDKAYGSLGDANTILDLGASIGTYAVYAAVTRPSARVWAYEPSAATYSLLKENVHLNDLDTRVTCVNAAVGREEQTRELRVDGPGVYFPSFADLGSVEEAGGVPVRTTTLQHILDVEGPAEVDLLKIDIEGAEYEALYATSPEHLMRVREIRMETHDLDDQGRNAAALSRFLASHGFRVTQHGYGSRNEQTLWASREQE